MISELIYTLDKSSKKDYCPRCTKKRFVRYFDNQEDSYLPEQYGRCDRESKCSYHLNPYKDGYNEKQDVSDWKPYHVQRSENIKAKPVFIPLDVFNKTRTGYEKNQFIQNLLKTVDYPFEVKDIEDVISQYHLGTIQRGYRKGAVTLPFIDVQNNVRTIQVKQFDKTNHTIGTDFLHSIIEKHHSQNKTPIPDWLKAYKENDKLVSCLFGEHLLSKCLHNPIALVEAPKTAIYGTLYFGLPKQPTDFIWLAVYNLSSLTLDKCKVLKGRNVYLFPDLSKGGKAYKLWSNKTSDLEKQLQGTSFIMSDLLERLASKEERKKGFDLADYLIKLDWRKFRNKTIQDQSKKWDNEISKLERFFENITLPNHPVVVNGYWTITDISKFIQATIEIVKKNNGNKDYLPFLNILKELRNTF